MFKQISCKIFVCGESNRSLLILLNSKGRTILYVAAKSSIPKILLPVVNVNFCCGNKTSVIFLDLTLVQERDQHCLA